MILVIIMGMAKSELTQYIIDAISRSDDINNLLIYICETTGMNWSDAKALVLRVQLERSEEIARKQRPLISIMSLIIFLIGSASTGYGIYEVIESIFTKQALFPADITTYLAPVIETGADPVASLKTAFVPYFRMIRGFLFSPFSAIFIGISMIFGSLRGMKEAWRGAINRWLDIIKFR